MLLVTKVEYPPKLLDALSSNFRHYKLDFRWGGRWGGRGGLMDDRWGGGRAGWG